MRYTVTMPVAERPFQKTRYRPRCFRSLCVLARIKVMMVVTRQKDPMMMAAMR